MDASPFSLPSQCGGTASQHQQCPFYSPSLHGTWDYGWYTGSSLRTPRSKSVLLSPFWEPLNWRGNREGTRMGVQHAEKTCLEKMGSAQREQWEPLNYFATSQQRFPDRLSHSQQPWAPSVLTASSSLTPTMVFSSSFHNLVPYQALSPTSISCQPLQGFLTSRCFHDTFHRSPPSVCYKTSLLVVMLSKCRSLNTFIFSSTGFSCFWKKAEPDWWQQEKLRQPVFLQEVEIA